MCGTYRFVLMKIGLVLMYFRYDIFLLMNIGLFLTCARYLSFEREKVQHPHIIKYIVDTSLFDICVVHIWLF